MNMKNNMMNYPVFLRCCYGYVVSRMPVPVVGVILPSLIWETGSNCALAGKLLFIIAIGDLFASLFFPTMVSTTGKRMAITTMVSIAPYSYLVLTFLPGIPVMYLTMALMGVAHGSIIITSNTTVNKVNNNSNKTVNLLHCSFAVGASLAPFLTALLSHAGLTRKNIMHAIVAPCVISTLSYAIMGYSSDGGREKHQNLLEKHAFLKFFGSYCIEFVLFFYLDVENCINGRSVTYLQSTEIMTETFATIMMSSTWLVTMAGQLVCVPLSKRYSKNAIVLMNVIRNGTCFFILISSSWLPVITMVLLGFGFFLAGIYPGYITNAGLITDDSTMGTPVLIAISVMGGTITPRLVGSATDCIGLVVVIGILPVSVIMVTVLSTINFRWLRQ